MYWNKTSVPIHHADLVCGVSKVNATVNAVHLCLHYVMHIADGPSVLSKIVIYGVVSLFGIAVLCIGAYKVLFGLFVYNNKKGKRYSSSCCICCLTHCPHYTDL